MRRFTKLMLIGVSASALSMAYFPAHAEDCTGLLPGVDCTLDEDTTAPLTIDNGVTLTVGANLTLGHTIDGSLEPGDGTVSTLGTGISITQQADIGSDVSIDVMEFTDVDAGGDTWTTDSAIITNNDGSDIFLGDADAGETLNFIAGGSYQGEIDGHGGDIVVFGSDDNGGTFVTGGQIETVALSIQSGTLTVDHRIGGGTPIDDLYIADGATLNLNESLSSAQALDLDGDVYIKSGNILTANTYTADADGGVVSLGVTRATETTEAGQLLIAAGGPVDLSNDTLVVVIEEGAQPFASETIAGVIAGNGGATIAPGALVDNSFLYEFSLVPNGDNLDLKIERNSVASTSDNNNNSRSAEVILEDLAASDNEQVNLVQSSLANASSREEFNSRLESTQPTVDGGYVYSSVAVVGQATGLIKDRVASVRGDGTSGLSAGNASDEEEAGGGKIWGRYFIYSGEQSSRGPVAGYDIESRGMTFGADTGDLEESSVIGVAFSYAESDIDSKNANSTSTEVESYLVSLYADQELAENTYLGGSVSYAYSNNDTRRENVGGVRGLDATAGFVSEQLSVNSEITKKYAVGGALDFTPAALLQYSYISADDYTERGAGGMDLFVDNDEFHIMEVGLGGTAAMHIVSDNGFSLIPVVEAQYKYDCIGDSVRAISRFSAGGPNIIADGFESQRHTIVLGTGLTFLTPESWKLDVGYNFENKGDFSSHSGYFKVAYKF